MYLDTSVLVAYYLPELKSAKAQTIIRENSPLVVSELCQLEFYSALGIRVRNKTLNRSDAQKVINLFENHLNNAYYLKKPINSSHMDKASEIMRSLEIAIKAPDAIHLVFAATQNLKLLTADKQLARNAYLIGVEAVLIE